MATTTITQPASFDRLRSALRFAVFAIIAVAILVATFVVARVSAPTHTVRTVVSVTAPAASAADGCRVHPGPC
jgi:hypothetical protein